MSEAQTYLTQAESLSILGLLRTEDLPEWAVSVLAAGVESEAILKLAICAPDEIEEISALFKKILKEGGGGSMSMIEALKHYARQVSTSILSAKISPLAGAKLIWQATISAQVHGFHDLDSFIYSASEMDERPEDKEFFERAIRDEAKRWSTWK